jgi:hypothetical protein
MKMRLSLRHFMNLTVPLQPIYWGLIIVAWNVIYIHICSYFLKGRDHSEDLGVGGKIIVEWNLGK